MTDVQKSPAPGDGSDSSETPTRDALEPGEAFAPGTSLVARVERSNAWRSVFRHPNLDTPRGRALQSFSNFFLHLYPVKIPARVLRIRYSFRLGFIVTVLFGILVLTGVYLMVGLTWLTTFQGDPPLYMAAVAFTAYGIHWFALAYRRAVREGTAG